MAVPVPSPDGQGAGSRARPVSPPTTLANASQDMSQVSSKPENDGSTSAVPRPPSSTMDHFRDADDQQDIYDRLSPRRKIVIVCVLSFCSFLSPLSSTSVLAAIPEVAETFHTTGSIIDVTNAVYTALMGVSPIVWAPISQVFGRRPILLLTAALFFIFSLTTTLSPNLAAFFVFRALSAFEGTSFILLGAAIVGDIYRPTERGTALGWFSSGVLVGPALGPVIGGIIVTHSSWRSIFWLQTACAGVAAVGLFFFVPETIHHKKLEDLQGRSSGEKTKAILHMINPIRVLRLFRYWNQVLVAFASSAMLWNMYSLLTPVRYVLNPRFHLQSPTQAGLFYLAPGAGYILGTFMGGRWADMTVRRWIKKRNGERVPEDRLRSGLPFLIFVMPASVLIYGWAVDKAVGGIPLPVIALFLQGVAQLFVFPSLNSYCLDVMPGLGAEVTAANYCVRYLFGCAGTAAVLPAIESIGVGWFETISALLLVVSGLSVVATIRWGKSWRESTDAKIALAHAAKKESVGSERAANETEKRKVEDAKSNGQAITEPV